MRVTNVTLDAHGLDFQRLLEIKEFDEITKCGVNMLVKPIVIFTVDGGPDENPRYRKVIEVGIHNFLEYNLDALFIACNAPGRSAYNRVERRMAPLSKELAGVVLPHDSYGSHLDAQGRTIDKELEKKNFGCAGNVLAEIWSSVIIDKYPVVAEYIPFENSELNASSLSSKDHTWFSQHVRTTLCKKCVIRYCILHTVQKVCYTILYTTHCAKSVLYDTVYYSVYSNIRKKYKHLLIEPYKQERILQYSQSRVVCGILANL